MRKLMTIFLLAMFLISFSGTAAGEEVTSEFTAKTGDNIEIIEYCSIDGFPCDQNFLCNMTVINPKRVTVITNDVMINQTDNFYNISLNSSNSAEIGLYEKTAYCDNGINNGTRTSYFTLTSTGIKSTIAQSIFYAIMFVISFFLFVSSIYAAVRIPFSNKIQDGILFDINYFKYAKMLLWVASYLLFIWVIYMTWIVSSSFLVLPLVSTFFFAILRFAIAFLFPALVIFFLFMFITYIEDVKLKKILTRGLQPR